MELRSAFVCFCLFRKNQHEALTYGAGGNEISRLFLLMPQFKCQEQSLYDSVCCCKTSVGVSSISIVFLLRLGPEENVEFSVECKMKAP